MRRLPACPRPGWQSTVEEVGLTWHTPGQPYWNESAFYAFTASEVDVLEAVTNELAEMAEAAARYAIENQFYEQLGIVESAIPLIEASWAEASPSLYGRFDLAYDGTGPPKLLEYNADTPTSLVEASVAQWYWLEDTHRKSDQFNNIHERLIGAWRQAAPRPPSREIDFCCADDAEDRGTINYLLDTAQQAGLSGSTFLIDEIGWDGSRLVSPDGWPLAWVFKLYPWEWMAREEFGKYLNGAGVIWIEPPWKMLLSNKGLLPLLWKLYPGHPNLLRAGWSESECGANWVRKPVLGREGANVTLHDSRGDVSTPGDYGDEGFVYQELAPVRNFGGKYPVIGSWVIGQRSGDVAAGIGVREADIPITTNLSQFVPHLFD